MDNRKLKIVLLLFSLLFVAGCSKEQSGGHNEASIKISVPQLLYTKALNSGDFESVINTLRVIVLPGGYSLESSEEPLANVLFSGEGLNNMVIERLPVGQVQIFAIANEAAIGKDYTDFNTFLADIEAATGKLLVSDLQRQYFPLRGSEKDLSMGLPMSWSDKNIVINDPVESGEPQEIVVQLRRCVSKIAITMANTLTTPITITKINFGAFFSDCFYLFWESMLDVPSGVNYINKEIDGLDITIAANSSEEMVLYLYPSHARRGTEVSPYTLGFSTAAGITYDPRHFLEGGTTTMSWIARNTQLNLLASLGANANVSITYYVAEWKDVTVEVPTYN